MARLPVPGNDSGTWGDVLNDFLSVELNPDGTLKKAGVIAAAASNDSVVHNSTNETIGGIKTFSSSPIVPTPTTSTQATNKAYVDSTVGAGAADATTSTKGIVKLAGDLSGTADLPTVPGLSTKEPTITAGTTSQYYRGDKSFQTLDKTAVGLSNVDNTADTTKPVSTAQQTALNAKIDKSTATTKGDILAATAASTIARVGVGTDGQVLTADAASTPGVKWATAGSGSVTSVVGQTGVVTGAQIAADSAVATTYAPQIQMRNLAKKVATIKSGTPGRVKWLSFGDSYAQKILLQINALLQQTFGLLAGTYLPGAVQGTTINATTGTVVGNLSDYDAWPSGLTESYSGGATRTYGVGGAAFICDSIKVYYVKEPSAGTFKLQVNGVDATGFTNVSAVGTLGQLGIASISPTLAANTVTIVSLTGTVRVIGVGFENSTLSGMCYCAVGQGGIALNAALTTGWSNFQAFLTDFAPDVLTFEMKENSSYLAASLDTFLTTVQAGNAGTDVVLIQSPPQAATDSDNVIQNGIYAAKARQYGVQTWDSYTPFKDYATLTAMGMNGDGTHVSTSADFYRGVLMMRDLRLTEVGRQMPLDVLSANITAKTALNIGLDPTTPNAQLLPSGATDVSARIRRWLRGYESTGVTEYWRLASDGSRLSFLPTYVGFGSGNAKIGGISARALSVVGGDNDNLSGDIQARSLATSFTTASVSGAVTADLSNAGQQILTLTGNITSFAFSNAGTSGQMIIVHFVQDATGSRTLASPSPSIKWAGSAPTLTTTASRRDIFKFVQQSGSYYEISRSMNVG